ncbi:hypothetical protein ['Camptotheca acuminata' phytoplasma]|uniref:hypothetical protein n=1 Tax='Camptotheca acuminata' phytoplasma TaxID=3239192 RepID=UPI00351A4B27
MQKAANEKFLSTKKGKIIVSSVSVGLIVIISVILWFALGRKSLKSTIEKLHKDANAISIDDAYTSDATKAGTTLTSVKGKIKIDEIKTAIDNFNKGKKDSDKIKATVDTLTTAMTELETKSKETGFTKDTFVNALNKVKDEAKKLATDINTQAKLEVKFE